MVGAWLILCMSSHFCALLWRASPRSVHPQRLNSTDMITQLFKAETITIKKITSWWAFYFSLTYLDAHSFLTWRPQAKFLSNSRRNRAVTVYQISSSKRDLWDSFAWSNSVRLSNDCVLFLKAKCFLSDEWYWKTLKHPSLGQGNSLGLFWKCSGLPLWVRHTNLFS